MNMWKRIFGYYFMACLAAESGFSPLLPSQLSFFLAPQAQARIFGRFFGRRPRGPSRARVQPRIAQPGRQRVAVNQAPVRRAAVNQGQKVVDNNVKDVLGFAALGQQGNALLEKDRNNPFLFRRLEIDPRTGALRGATRGDTRGQLKEFFLKNFDKFKGVAKQQVNNFLLANGAAAALNGQLRVDVATGVAPKYKNMGDANVRVSALNFLLNSISQTSRLLRIDRAGSDGTVGLNLSGVMRSSALALLTNDNPYACGRNVPPRVDFLIERAMDPTIYNQLLEIKTLRDSAAEVGVQDDKKRTPGNKIVIAAPPGAKPESIVGVAPERTLEVQSQQRRPGRDWFISWDTVGNNGSRTETESRNPFESGINFTHDASEAIWHKSNGFLQFGLFNAAGVAQTQAPGNVAIAVGHGRSHLGEAVQAPFSCMDCHSNGFRGGGLAGEAKSKDRKPYTDNFLGIDPDGNRIGSRIRFNREFFTTNAAYNARAERASAIYINAVKRSGSFVPSDTDSSQAATLIPDFLEEYRSPLSFATMAKELGTSKEAVQARFQGRPEGQMARKTFEREYCSLLRSVGGPSVLTGGVSQSLGVNGLSRPAHNPGASPVRRRQL